MHIGPVINAVTDAAKRIAITTGDDATARIWSLPDLRLLRVIRPPIGWELGPQVAVTPDGRFVALSAGAGVFIYEVATGNIVRGIPLAQSWGRISAIAISPDGTQVVIGRGPNGDGCWLFSFNFSGDNLWRNCGLSQAIFHKVALALVYAPDGRLATASTEETHNNLTIFDPAGNILSDTPVNAMVGFEGLSFNPDGGRLAIAYRSMDQQIEIRDGRTLAAIAKVDTRDLSSLLPNFAWSFDGATLYATGMRHKSESGKFGDRTPVFAWDGEGTGRRREALIEQYRHHSISVLPDKKFPAYHRHSAGY